MENICCPPLKHAFLRFACCCCCLYYFKILFFAKQTLAHSANLFAARDCNLYNVSGKGKIGLHIVPSEENGCLRGSRKFPFRPPTTLFPGKFWRNKEKGNIRKFPPGILSLLLLLWQGLLLGIWDQLEEIFFTLPLLLRTSRIFLLFPLFSPSPQFSPPSIISPRNSRLLPSPPLSPPPPPA